MEEFTFRMRRIFQQVALDYGLNVDPNRLAARKIEREDKAGQVIIQAMFGLATQDEEVFEFPDNWMIHLCIWVYKAQLKVRQHKWFHWIPKPGKMVVWAIHKFPDVNVPLNLIGNEFVHFKVEKVV